MKTRIFKNPFGKYSGLAEAMNAVLHAEDTSEVYEHVYRFLDRSLSVLCVKVIEHQDSKSPLTTIWANCTSPGFASLFSIPPEALGDFRTFPCVRALPVEEETANQTQARSLILASIETPTKDIQHKLLVWVADEEVENDSGLFLVLRVFTSLAAQVLAINKTRQSQTDEHRLLHEIVESVPQAIVAVSHEDQVLICNRNTEFLFRVRRADVIGQRYQDVLPPPLAETMSELIQSAAQGGQELDKEFEFPAGRKTKLRLGISLSPRLAREDRAASHVFVIQDTSLRNEVQTLRQSHRMSLEFVHTLSHEIKAPLTTILLGAGDLLGQGDRPDPGLQTVRLIDDSAKRIEELVNDLLDVAKLESGHAELETEVQDLGAMVKKLVDGYQRLQKVDIRLEIDAGLPPLKFDRKQIQRALENLIRNAIKYSLRAPEIRVAVTRKGDSIKVAVADQGVGVPAAQLALVWEKFYRGLTPDTADVPGSGLGLTIVKEIISMHGGEVEAQSEVGHGSVFAFTLPLRGR